MGRYPEALLHADTQSLHMSVPQPCVLIGADANAAAQTQRRLGKYGSKVQGNNKEGREAWPSWLQGDDVV